MDPEAVEIEMAKRKSAAHAIPFVKYSCGCLGFPPNTEGYAVLIETCDRRGEDDQLWWGSRDMVGKDYNDAPLDEKMRLSLALAKVVDKGNQLDRVKQALGI